MGKTSFKLHFYTPKLLKLHTKSRVVLKPVADSLANIGGKAYCFGRMTLHISIVLEQKTIVFQNIGGHRPPHLPPSVCHRLKPMFYDGKNYFDCEAPLKIAKLVEISFLFMLP